MKIASPLLFLAVLVITSSAGAKLPPRIAQALEERFPPAEWHRGLETAHEAPDPEKLKGFVIVKREGIPVERAPFFISWEAYDYRSALVKHDKLTTRRGKPYAHLRPGDAMAVAAIESFGRTIWMKLISPEVYIPVDKKDEKRHSRVTVRFGIRFPTSVFQHDDADTVIAAFEAWITPQERNEK